MDFIDKLNPQAFTHFLFPLYFVHANNFDYKNFLTSVD